MKSVLNSVNICKVLKYIGSFYTNLLLEFVITSVHLYSIKTFITPVTQ